MEAAYMYTSYLLLLCCTCTIGTGGVTINYSPGISADIAPVCSGDELELTCAISGRVLEWNGSIPWMQPEFMTFKHTLTSAERLSPVHTKNFNDSISFTFSRISPPDSHPLISRLLISPATGAVNGTVVICQDRETRNSSATTVNVVHNNNIDDSSTLTDAVHIVNFTSDSPSKLPESTSINLSVSLQLNGTNPSFPYLINVVPDEHNVSAAVSNITPTFELRVQYDTLYNVSIMVCGESSAPLIGLYYSKCATDPEIIDYDGHLQGTFNSPTDRDCPLTSSQATTGTNATKPTRSTGATLGVTLGTFLFVTLMFGTVVVFTIVGAVLVVKRRGLKNSDSRRMQNEREESTTDYSSLHHDLGPKNATKGLVYAEVGHVVSHQHQQNIPPSFLNLDDTPIEYAQINHKLHNMDKSNRTEKPLPPEQVDDSVEVNLDNLLIQLRPQVTTKWYQFGETAGIKREVLDNFAKQCSPNDCIMEMLDYWLRNSKQLPTWKDVAKILKEIDLTQLGHDIDEVYKTGKLPVRVDMNWIPQIPPAPVESEFTEPPPPAVPPKMMRVEEWTNAENSTHLEQKYSTLQTESEASIPALPPKPNNNQCMTNIPTRPPKPTGPKTS